MGSLVLLVVAAVWVAVLVPPLVRSRLENRPNSSVSDFRAQLSSLQRAVPSSRTVSMRPMARPLAPSGMARPPANRPPLRSGVTIAGGGSVRSAGQQAAMRTDVDVRPSDPSGRGRVHGEGPTRSHARPAADATGRDDVKRRRANVLFMLVLIAACATFLAVTTKSPGMTYAAVGAGIAVVAYLMVLAQAAMAAAPARSRARHAAAARRSAPERRAHADRPARAPRRRAGDEPYEPASDAYEPERPASARRRPAPDRRYRGERAYQEPRRAPRPARPVADDWGYDEPSYEHPVYGEPLHLEPARAAGRGHVADLDEWAAARAATPARRRDHRQPAPSRSERAPRQPRPARQARAARHRTQAHEWSQDPRPSGQMWGDPLFA